MTQTTKHILVGKIVAAQGIHGDVRVQTFTASPLDFKNLEIICDKFSAPDFKFVRLLNPTSSVIVAHIKGIDDRTNAEKLRGTELFISRDALPEPDDGEFYQADLIGFAVVRNGEKIGTVTGFQNFGAGDIIELENGDMVSFVGANVDIPTKTIYVK